MEENKGTGLEKWSGKLLVDLVRMPPCSLHLEVFRAQLTGRRPQEGPRTHWREYTSHLAWEHLWIPQRRWRDSLGRGTSGFSSWSCCFCDSTSDKRNIMDRWTFYFRQFCFELIIYLSIKHQEAQCLCVEATLLNRGLGIAPDFLNRFLSNPEVCNSVWFRIWIDINSNNSVSNLAWWEVLTDFLVEYLSPGVMVLLLVIFSLFLTGRTCSSVHCAWISLLIVVREVIWN